MPQFGAAFRGLETNKATRRWLCDEAWERDYAEASKVFCNSPDSYISIMMSEPPMNSPLM